MASRIPPAGGFRQPSRDHSSARFGTFTACDADVETFEAGTARPLRLSVHKWHEMAQKRAVTYVERSANR